MKMVNAFILVLVGGLLIYPHDALAGPFGIAGDYNIFVFGDIVEAGTDVQGRVAAGGNATYTSDGLGRGFSIAQLTPNGGPAELVAGHNVTLENGSIGNGLGTVVYGGTANIAPNVGYGMLTNGEVIDFASEQSFLTSMSAYWGSLNANGSTSVLSNGNIELTGTDASLNVFSLQASDITQNIAFSFTAPTESTVLVNVSGAAASFMNLGFFFNGVAGEDHAPGLPATNPGYPYSHILFNFLTATDLNIDFVAINAAILAPLAHVDFGENSHIDGTLIAASLTGFGEAHDLQFDGDLPSPVPEPSTWLLLMGGLGLVAFRQRSVPSAAIARR